MLFFYLLLTAVFASFITHVYLLFTSFPRHGFVRSRYILSHLTLALAGVIAWTITELYAGKGMMRIVDAFDSGFARAAILAGTLVLSLLAHSIVRFFVLPSYRNHYRKV